MLKGLDKLTRQLDGAEKALKELDGELGTIHFDPSDPTSIEKAITDIETIIDERVGQYASNPIIQPLIEAMKETYRSGILERASEARLNSDDSK